MIKLCFLLNNDFGMVKFVTTDLLLQNTFEGLSIGIPNIHNLKCEATIISTAILRSAKSKPNIDDSTVLCALKYHVIGDLFKYINIPVCD